MKYTMVEAITTTVTMELIKGVNVDVVFPLPKDVIFDSMIIPALAGHIKMVQYSESHTCWDVFENAIPGEHAGSGSLYRFMSIKSSEIPVVLQRKFMEDSEDPEACMDLAKILLRNGLSDG